MDNKKAHLKSLIQLAVSDNNFADIEKNWIYSIGRAHRIPENEIDELIAENLNPRAEFDVYFDGLSFDEKFEFLYNVIQLMKIDNEVFLSEIRYCQALAERLGFDKRVVNKLSPKIYADPKITSDRESLKKVARKFELKQ